MGQIEFGIMYSGTIAIMWAKQAGLPECTQNYAAAWTAYWFVRQVLKLGGV